MSKNLQQLARQLAEIWKQLGLNQRVSLVLGAGVVLVGLIGLTFWSSRPDFVLLYGKLDDTEAAKVLAALDEAKIPHQSGRGGSSILVPSDKVYQVRAQLAAKGIPRGEGVGFEIFDKPNFGISDFVQHANYLRALQGELARTISQIDQVESARVMIVMPENRLLIDAQKKPTASVFVRTRNASQLNPSAVNSIRFLVANAVEGLQGNNVSIVDHLGNVLSENHDNDSVGGLSNNQLTARRNLEQYLSKKAEGMLEKALGPGQAVVRVSADLSWDTTSRVEEKYDPEGQVMRSTVINDETTVSSTSEGGSGAARSSGNAETNVPGAAQANNSQTKKKVSNNQYEISRITSNILLPAGGIRRLSAAVFIAQAMEGEGKDRKPVARSDEEMQKLKRIVQSAVGLVENDPTRKDDITLEQLPFNDQSAVDLTQRLETDTRRTFYWDIGKNVLFGCLAFGIFGVFLKLLKKTSSADIPLGIPLGQANGSGAAPGSADHAGMENWRAEAKPGVVTVEVLNALIKENPGNMTQAVRSWLTGSNKSN